MVIDQLIHIVRRYGQLTINGEMVIVVMIYGEIYRIQALQDNDLVLQIGMCQVAENGWLYTIY